MTVERGDDFNKSKGADNSGKDAASAHESFMQDLHRHTADKADVQKDVAEKPEGQKPSEKLTNDDPRLQKAEWLAENRTVEQNHAAAVDSLQRVAAIMDKLHQAGCHDDVAKVIGGNFYGGVIKEGQATPDKVKHLLSSLKQIGDVG